MSSNARQRHLFTSVCLLLNLCWNLPQNLEASGTQFGVEVEAHSDTHCIAPSSYPLIKPDGDQTRTNKTFNSWRASARWVLQTSLRPDKIRAHTSKEVQLTYFSLPGWINRCGDNWHVWNMGLFSSFTFFTATVVPGLRESLHERIELCWRSLRPWELGPERLGTEGLQVNASMTWAFQMMVIFQFSSVLYIHASWKGTYKFVFKFELRLKWEVTWPHESGYRRWLKISSGAGKPIINLSGVQGWVLVSDQHLTLRRSLKKEIGFR